ncbi:hypothetical protein [Nocardiopsis alborubida]|uniref:hypothetical protein n=1 Tax=Nocardiopsis alborubida TaxID=146802 RepID=UPI001B34F8FC|nr:hypothetical protein [Nocardiopsis alborubida]
MSYTLVEARFDSDLHARWSVFFDDLHINYLYTPCTFKDRTGQDYSPAFYLPEQKVWVHAEVERAPQWWNEFRLNASKLLRTNRSQFAPQWRGDALLTVGPFPFPYLYNTPAGPWHPHEDPDVQMGGKAHYEWTLCPMCGSFGATYFGYAEQLPCRCLEYEGHRKVRNGDDSRLLRAYRSAYEENTIRPTAAGGRVIRSAILNPDDPPPFQSRRCAGACQTVAELTGADSPGNPSALEGAEALCGLCPELVCGECAQRPTDEIGGHCQVCAPRPLLSEFGARRALNAYVTAQAGPPGTPDFEKACAFFNSDINHAMGVRSRPDASIADLVAGLNFAHDETDSAEPGIEHLMARRKARTDAYYKELRERSKAAKTSPLSQAQHDYLVRLAHRVGPEVFDAHLAVAIRGTDIAPRARRELCVRVIDRLTGATASKLISRLKAHLRRPAPKSKSKPT